MDYFFFAIIISVVVVTGQYLHCAYFGAIKQRDPSNYSYEEMGFESKESLDMAFRGYQWPKWGDFWITFMAAMIIHAFNKCFEAWSYPYLYEWQRERDEILRVKKATKNV